MAWSGGIHLHKLFTRLKQEDFKSQASLGYRVRTCVKIEKLKKDWDLSSVAQCLPGMYKAFCPTLNNKK